MTNAGPKWLAVMEETGEVLGDFKDPDFDATRTLQDRGYTGKMTTRWQVSKMAMWHQEK